MLYVRMCVLVRVRLCAYIRTYVYNNNNMRIYVYAN